MKRIFPHYPILTLLSMMVLNLAACGSGTGSGTDGPRSTVEINGKAPRDYYNQFLWKITGSCEGGDVNFHYLSSDTIELRTTPQGRKVFGQMDIVLLNDSEFYGSFEEREVVQGTPTHYTFTVLSREQDKGRYSIDKSGRLVLTNVGHGSALAYNNSDVVQFLFNAKNIEGLDGKSTILRYMEASGSPLPGHRSFNEHCGRTTQN